MRFRPAIWVGAQESQSEVGARIGGTRQRVNVVLKSWARRKIVELCATPQSIAEVSAHLSIPLGVARVLVGDLAAEGLLAVRDASAAAASDVSLLERVLNGLKAL